MKIGVELLDEKYKCINMNVEEFAYFINILSSSGSKTTCNNITLKFKNANNYTIVEAIFYTELVDNFHRKKALRILVVLTKEEIRDLLRNGNYSTIASKIEKLIKDIIDTEYVRELDTNSLLKCIISAIKENRKYIKVLKIINNIYSKLKKIIDTITKKLISFRHPD